MATDKQFLRIQALRGHVAQVTDELAEYSKGVLPPIYSDDKTRFPIWAMGEPVSSSGDEPTYYWFGQHNLTWYATYGTYDEAVAVFGRFAKAPATRDELYRVIENIHTILTENKDCLGMHDYMIDTIHKATSAVVDVKPEMV